MSPTTSQPLVHQLLALSSHSNGVLISVASLPLKAVHSANCLAFSSWYFLTSSSPNISIADCCIQLAKSVPCSLSATAFQALSIHCPIILYPRFHGD
jgi:hypothetical protein